MNWKVFLLELLCATVIYAIATAITEHLQTSRRDTRFIMWMAGSISMGMLSLISK